MSSFANLSGIILFILLIEVFLLNVITVLISCICVECEFVYNVQMSGDKLKQGYLQKYASTFKFSALYFYFSCSSCVVMLSLSMM